MMLLGRKFSIATFFSCERRRYMRKKDPLVMIVPIILFLLSHFVFQFRWDMGQLRRKESQLFR